MTILDRLAVLDTEGSLYGLGILRKRDSLTSSSQSPMLHMFMREGASSD